MRLDTISLRGMFNQRIHGSKRKLCSVEDLTEFEFRTGYFNADPSHAIEKAIIIVGRHGCINLVLETLETLERKLTASETTDLVAFTCQL